MLEELSCCHGMGVLEVFWTEIRDEREARWWFQIFFIFNPTWGNDPIWLIFFKWVETTNQEVTEYQTKDTSFTEAEARNARQVCADESEENRCVSTADERQHSTDRLRSLYMGLGMEMPEWGPATDWFHQWHPSIWRERGWIRSRCRRRHFGRGKEFVETNPSNFAALLADMIKKHDWVVFSKIVYF